jgi:hypothetical protein
VESLLAHWGRIAAPAWLRLNLIDEQLAEAGHRELTRAVMRATDQVDQNALSLALRGGALKLAVRDLRSNTEIA